MLFVQFKLWIKQYLKRDGVLWKLGERAYKEINQLRRLKGGYGTLPDYIICGAQKSGTTSLYHYLIQHPYIHGATTKEVHYFDKAYGEDVSWYRSHFPLALSRNLAQLRDKPFSTGEASPYYMFHPLVPQRIHELLPEVKLIFLLRDPVQRALSHYNHAVSKGFEERSFEKAVTSEESIVQGDDRAFLEEHPEDHLRRSYVARGRYSEQINRFRQRFRDEQMLFLESQNLFQNPQETTNRVFGFLGIPEYGLEKYHEMNQRDYSIDMSQDTLRWLENHFEPYNEKLKRMSGIDFNAVEHNARND